MSVEPVPLEPGCQRKIEMLPGMAALPIPERGGNIRQLRRFVGPVAMIKIAISGAAFEAIASTLPLGSVAYKNEPQLDANGQRFVWLPPAVVSRLSAMRGPGETYSDAILRLSEMERP